MTKSRVLILYKQLLRKADTLKYTDKDYYLKRIRQEFESNRFLSEPSAIDASVQVSANRPSNLNTSYRENVSELFLSES